MSALVEVRNVMAIVGRGGVVIAYVRSGVVCVGQRTAPLGAGVLAGRRLEISALERLTGSDVNGDAVGLVFRERPAAADLHAAFPPGAPLVLEDAAAGAST